MARVERALVDAGGLLLMLSSVGCLGPRFIERGDDDVGDDTTASGPEPTTDVDPPPPGMPPADTGVDTGLDTDGTVTTVTVGSVSVSVGEVSSDPTNVSATTDAPPPISEACTAYGEQVAECYDPRTGASATAYCTEVLELYAQYYGAECLSAFEDWLVCLSSLSCEEFTGPDPVCQEENQLVEQACVP